MHSGRINDWINEFSVVNNPTNVGEMSTEVHYVITRCLIK